MKVKVSKVIPVITGLWHETKDNSEIGKVRFHSWNLRYRSSIGGAAATRLGAYK